MADKTYRGVTMTPIFQFAQNNGLDEKEFFDFIKSKWGEEGTKGLTLESDVPHGTLEKMFDEYADKKFKERPKRDIFTDKDKEYLDFTPPSAKGKMWKVGLYNKVGDESDLKKFVREGDDLDVVVKQLIEENPEYAKGGYDAQMAEEGEDLDEWLKLPGWHKGVKDEDTKVEDVDTSTIDEKDSGKSEEDDLDLYMKDLNDYMDKNKKGRDDIPVTTRR